VAPRGVWVGTTMLRSITVKDKLVWCKEFIAAYEGVDMDSL
jgi:hypothetical protein